MHNLPAVSLTVVLKVLPPTALTDPVRLLSSSLRIALGHDTDLVFLSPPGQQTITSMCPGPVVFKLGSVFGFMEDDKRNVPL